MFFCPVLSLAQEGALDPTFGTDGIVISGLGGWYEYAHAVAIQEDGKIVVAGRSDTCGEQDFAVIRYNYDGTLDSSFDYDGLVLTDFSGYDDYIGSVAIQEDGKIVLAGHSHNGSEYNFALVRYNINGTLDNSFNDDGKVITDFGESDGADALAIQEDGKIVVLGGTSTVIYTKFALARYNVDGSLDNTFGTDGKVITDIGYRDYAFSIAIQGDGKIVAGGYIRTGPELDDDDDFALLRYNTDGNLDSSFGIDGKVLTDFEGLDDQCQSLTIQLDGKILLAGLSWHNSDADFGLARYNIDGTLDTSFSNDGKVTTDFFGNIDYAYSISIQEDGKIVAGGSTNNPYDFALARYNTDGTLDNSFDSDGKVNTDFGDLYGVDYSYDDATEIAISDGKIIAVGYGHKPFDDFDYALARYIAVCNIDTSVTQSQNTLTTNASGFNYQWINCDTGIPIPGETNETFTATSSGNFAVIISDGPCSDTSSCYNITVVDIESFPNPNSEFSITPNPFTSEILITGKSSNAEIILLDISGREILRQTPVLGTSLTKLNTEQLLPGLYILNYNSGNKTENYKLVKN